MKSITGTILKFENGYAVLSVGDERILYIPEELVTEPQGAEIIVETKTKKEYAEKDMELRRVLLTELVN